MYIFVCLICVKMLEDGSARSCVLWILMNFRIS